MKSPGFHLEIHTARTDAGRVLLDAGDLLIGVSALEVELRAQGNQVGADALALLYKGLEHIDTAARRRPLDG